MKNIKRILGFVAVLGLIAFVAPTYAAAPDGAGPWADTVIASLQGDLKNGGNVAVDRSDPTQALGIAESTGSDYDNPVTPGTFFALGFGGSLTLGFDNTIIDGDGNDFQIYEITGGTNYPDELVDIEISANGIQWWLAATDVQRDALVDLAGTPFACIHYVRVTDTSNVSLFEATADGYDVDGAKSLHENQETCASAPSIEVVKTSDAPEEGVFTGTEVVYTYEVTNTGDVDLDNVNLSDDKCLDPVYQSGDTGDDGFLSTGETWIYECSMILEETTENTATVTADDPFDTEISDEDILEVVVKDPGCTLTQGYWKNHHTDGNAKKVDDTWIAGDPIDVAWDWLTVFQTPPQGGNIWYKLAHQWMAAKLNSLSGANDSDVMPELGEAQTWLEANAVAFMTASKKELKGLGTGTGDYDSSWAGLFASYNEGLTGPGHCSETNNE